MGAEEAAAWVRGRFPEPVAGLFELLPEAGMRAEVWGVLVLLREGGVYLAPDADVAAPVAEWAALDPGLGCSVTLAQGARGSLLSLRAVSAALKDDALMAHVASHVLEAVARGTRETRGWRGGAAERYAGLYTGPEVWTDAVLSYFGVTFERGAEDLLALLGGAPGGLAVSRISAGGVAGIRLERGPGFSLGGAAVRDDWLGDGPWDESNGVCIFSGELDAKTTPAAATPAGAGGSGDGQVSTPPGGAAGVGHGRAALPGRRPFTPGPGVLGAPPIYYPSQLPGGALLVMALPGAAILGLILAAWRSQGPKARVSRRRTAGAGLRPE